MRALWIWVLALAGCLQSASVPCGDRTCPAGTVCEPTRVLCLLPEQQTVCVTEGLATGARCDAAGTPGICQDTLCLPGCGDGTTLDAEECDDGNFASHDGCSSTCRVETPVWTPFRDAWTPIQRHVAAFHEGIQRLVVVTGISDTGLSTTQWHREAVNPMTPAQGWKTAESDLGKPAVMPPPRTGAAMVYDSARSRLVLFGGIGDIGQGDNYLADTWEYDASTNTWTLKPTAKSPPGRFRHAMIFDPIRNRVVMFGGSNATALGLGDTWEYDGTTWTENTSTPAPEPRAFPGMTWDSDRDVGVLFGGTGAVTFNDTWEYSNGAWQEISTATKPPARRDHAMAYFPALQRTILFGGAIPGVSGGAASDLWEYDGSNWAEISTAISPAGRRAATLTAVGDTLVLVGGTVNFAASPFEDVWELNTSQKWSLRTPRFEPPVQTGSTVYDEDNRQLVVLGNTSGTSTEQWSFDGERWVDVTSRTTALPPVGFDAAMSYDPVRKRVITFGGVDADVMNTTYELDGKTLVWKEVTGSAPPARASAAMAFDGQTQRTILFGGYDLAGALGDTWAFDGTTWTLQPPSPTGPAKSDAPVAAWDPKLERLVMVDNEGDTFKYDQGAWTPIARDGDQPDPRIGAAMTFDWQRERILLVGGQSRSRVYFDEVWELDGETWAKLDIHGGSALPRSYYGLASHRWGRKTVLYGGSNGAGSAADTTWFFQYVSETPDEDCTDDIDDDGDQQPDDIDPDCIRRAQ